MADRRMLAKTVTEHDNFVALSAAAQALYMHLTLSADDDGFCSQISTAMFRAHAKKKDLEALISAHYLIRFETGVIVIKHWRMANSNRADRYTPTVYQEEYQRLTVKENKAYTLVTDARQTAAEPETDRQPTDTHLATTWQPSDAVPAPQKRREEKRIEEKSITARTPAHTPARTREDEDDGFEAFWSAYPKKTGEIRGAYLEFVHALETGATPEALMDALEWQSAEWAEEGQPRYIPSAEKWLKNRRWEEKRRERPKPKGPALAQDLTEVGAVDMSQLERTLAQI